ncbi:2'-5' RNA ligase family protein [Rhizorhabdus argentea]|uniref:2'-5' RNA ligase family protein n=1 Tax=Rhizorhabdus argentea TaxID=1387174 RepID=UPI0030EC86AC
MPGSAHAPIIVTATIGPEDFAWADGLRRAHFPAERNQRPAHLTLFHHLPPSSLESLKHMVASELRSTRPPAARVARLLSLGRGVALGIDSPGLVAIRARIAEAMHGLLTPQDQAAWRPHITIQNKAAPSEARALLQALREEFKARPIKLAGLAAYWYRGGPLEPIAEWRFRG